MDMLQRLQTCKWQVEWHDKRRRQLIADARYSHGRPALSAASGLSERTISRIWEEADKKAAAERAKADA